MVFGFQFFFLIFKEATQPSRSYFVAKDRRVLKDERRGIISIVYMNIDQHYNLPIVQVYSSGILFFFVTTVSGTALRVVRQTSLYTTNRFKYFKIHQLIL